MTLFTKGKWREVLGIVVRKRVPSLNYTKSYEAATDREQGAWQAKLTQNCDQTRP